MSLSVPVCWFLSMTNIQIYFHRFLRSAYASESCPQPHYGAQDVFVFDPRQANPGKTWRKMTLMTLLFLWSLSTC